MQRTVGQLDQIVWTAPTIAMWRATMRGKERRKEKGNGWNIGIEGAVKCGWAGAWFSVACIPNGVAVVAPQAAKP
jgi:hypothetical protein